MGDIDFSKCQVCGHPKHIGRTCGHEDVVPPGYPPRTCDCSDAQARKNSKGKKGGYYLVPWKSIEDLATIYYYGAQKYEANSWRKVPPDPDTKATTKERYIDAMMRHWTLYMQGEWLDKESNLPHLHHFLWGAMAVNELERDERTARGEPT
jgi:hypothetical protein